MINNYWMVLCLLLGFILACAMISSIPIYTDGALQRMLTKDLEKYQNSTGHFPGTYSIKKKLFGMEKQEAIKLYDTMNKTITEKLFAELKVPAVSDVKVLTNDFLSIAKAAEDKNGKNTPVKVEALTGIEEHITIVQGKLPSSEKKEDIYEVMATEAGMKELDLILDKVYNVSNILGETKEAAKFKVVGVFSYKDKSDAFWYDGNWQRPESLIMDFSLFSNEYMKEGLSSITDVQWYYALDYHRITINGLKGFLGTIERHANTFKSYSDLEFTVPSADILKSYNERAEQLRTTLWVLQIPVLIMLIFYLFMAAELTVAQERTEIAVLKSRGASRLQIISGYMLQGVILSAVAVLLGPPLGLFVCELIGASNGFLEFVNRSSLNISLSLRPYYYSILASGVFIITLVLPVLKASKTSIVLHKQQNNRTNNKSLWKKYFIDIILLAVSCYGIYAYKSRINMLRLSGIKGNEIPVDPLLFFISTIFIFSCGLFFLRIFPYMVNFIYFLGKRKWGPATYSSLLNVGRDSSRHQFLMLFLILTISIGIFNANSARTINNNVDERERYNTGADITILQEWPSTRPAPVSVDMQGTNNSAVQRPVYMEPPFSPYEKLSGVEQATKVFRKHDAEVSVGDKSYSRTYVMGINPDEFGKVAWFRASLLSHHWYNYLNMMTKDQRAFLVSRSFEKKYNCKLGDTIYIKWDENDLMAGVIYGFVDYWPTFNPYDKENGSPAEDLVVANLSYIQSKMKLEPYEVWIKEKTGVSTAAIYDDIKLKGLPILALENANQKIIIKKNDPMLQGTNGALTMSFIITILISAIGFLIYWILAIRSRTLQFGIFRAMGLSLREVIGMLFCEQLLISGTSIIIGIIIGGITSDLFVPMLQIIYSSSEQVPPFRVVAYGKDYIKLYASIGIMLTMGLTVLGRFLSSMKVSQAIKLGED